MRTLDTFRNDHIEILGIAYEIKRLLTPHHAKAKSMPLYILISTLARRTLAHLLLEDHGLYRELLLSDHEETRLRAQQHTVHMGDLTDKLHEYTHRWNYDGLIASHPKQFCDDTHELLRVIESRIEHEETLLYPISEAHS